MLKMLTLTLVCADFFKHSILLAKFSFMNSSPQLLLPHGSTTEIIENVITCLVWFKQKYLLFGFFKPEKLKKQLTLIKFKSKGREMAMSLGKLIIWGWSNQLHINLTCYLVTHSSHKYKWHIIKPKTKFVALSFS